MNSEIDSSVASSDGEGSFGGLASLVSAAVFSEFVGGVAAAFDDPSTATLKATGDPNRESRKERKFENKSSKENDWKNLTSFNWAFTTVEDFQLGCEP